MVKIRYRGNDLSDPDMAEVKKEMILIQKKFKKVRCLNHDTPTIIHLRYVKLYPVLETYVQACCYEFEKHVKSKLHEEINV